MTEIKQILFKKNDWVILKEEQRKKITLDGKQISVEEKAIKVFADVINNEELITSFEKEFDLIYKVKSGEIYRDSSRWFRLATPNEIKTTQLKEMF